MATGLRPSPMTAPAYSTQGKVGDVFFVNLNFIPIPASGSLSQKITFDTDADVLVYAGTRTVTTDAAPATVLAAGPLTVSIKVSSSGRDLMNEVGHLENIFGSGQQPAYWPRPRLFSAGETLTVTLANLSAVAHRAFLTLYAAKVYDRG